jgi:hypothetical protein
MSTDGGQLSAESAWEPEALRRWAATTHVLLYGLATPLALQCWVASMSARSISFGYLLTGGREVEVGAAGRTPTSEAVGDRTEEHSRRVGLARDLALRTRYPSGGAVDRGREWWERWADAARSEAEQVAANSQRWEATVVRVDEVEVQAWLVRLEAHWGMYCEHDCAWIHTMGVGARPLDLALRSLTTDELAPYAEGTLMRSEDEADDDS